MALHQKVDSNLDAPFAEKSLTKGEGDINAGDTVTILKESQTIPDRFNPGQKQTIIKIKTRNGDRYMSLNQKSINILIDEFGSNDDKNWVGKEAKILLNPTVIAGKKALVAYLAGGGWILDDFGDPINPAVQDAPQEDLPTIDVDDENPEVDINDIPF